MSLRVVATRRRVTYGQLELMWENLNRNRGLATGYNKTAQARELSRRMWESIAVTLNAHGEGAVKDWRGWLKYWNDYKSKLKSRVAALRASFRRTGGGPSSEQPLTDLEEKFLQILGEGFGSGIPDVRVEPFEDAPSVTSQHESESLLFQWQNNELHLLNVDDSLEQPLTPPLHIPRRSPRLISRNGSPAISAVLPIPNTLNRSANIAATPRRRTPRQHRRRRGELPAMTQEAARRALCADSIERTNLSREKLVLFRSLVEELRDVKKELREIKYILNSR